MDELKVLERVLERPLMNMDSRRGSALIAFLAGYSEAVAKYGGESPQWNSWMLEVRNRINPAASDTSLSTLTVALKAAGGDDERAFEILKDEFKSMLARHAPKHREGQSE